MADIGRLEPISWRELWPHEEHGFSKWLESHLDVLSDALGFRLSDPRRETAAGTFECDLVCEGENGDLVIIENQLERTDHDHLGKVLTYLANLDAKAAIWIATSARPEHLRAVQWLNETTPAGTPGAPHLRAVRRCGIPQRPVIGAEEPIALPSSATVEAAGFSPRKEDRREDRGPHRAAFARMGWKRLPCCRRPGSPTRLLEA
jgi:hypothetical protein